MSTSALLLIALASVVLLLLLVIKAKAHPFVALLIVSLLVAFATGIPADKIITTIEKGMGGVEEGVDRAGRAVSLNLAHGLYVAGILENGDLVEGHPRSRQEGHERPVARILAAYPRYIRATHNFK